MAKQYAVVDAYENIEIYDHYGDALEAAKEYVAYGVPQRIFSLHMTVSETSTGSIKIETHG